MQIEATVRVDRRRGPGFVTAGLSLFLDPNSHWRLLLVAGPAENRGIPVGGAVPGIASGAAHAPPPAASHLAGKQEGNLPGWEYGRAYRLLLTVSPQGIVGEIQDPTTNRSWRQTYSFAVARTVREGRPSLTAAGVEGIFRDFTVNGPQSTSASQLTVARGKSGSVALVEDQSGQLAAALERLLVQAGYGVTRVKWGDVQPGRLPAASLDLLILADARRLPASAVATVETYLRAGGRLLAIGRPPSANCSERLRKATSNKIATPWLSMIGSINIL